VAESGPCERLLFLLERGEQVEVDDFNRVLLEEIGPGLGDRDEVSYLSVHLADAISREASVGPGAGTASFAGVLEIGLDDSSVWESLAPRASVIAAAHAYRVERRHVKHYPRSWPDGTRSPGLFMVSPVVRAAGLSHEQFDAHWRDRHAPLALRHHVGIWDYRQSGVCQVLTPGSPVYDGIAHMGFPDLDSYRTGFFDSPEGRRIITEDIERFLTLGRSQAMLLGETVLKS